MRMIGLVLGLCVLSGCVIPPANTQLQGANQVVTRGVHSGVSAKVEAFYSVMPTCEIKGYPEIMIVSAPSHGNVTFEKHDDYPNFGRDNVRWECDKKLVGTMQVFYESKPDFHGHDTFTLKVIFPDSGIRTVPFSVEVL
jgi:hypothetical protein